MDSENKKADYQLQRTVKWQPTEQMVRVKSRFFRRLEEMKHAYDLKTVLKSEEAVEAFAGCKQIHTWLKSPSFQTWFLDQDYFDNKLQFLKHKSLALYEHIIDADPKEANLELKSKIADKVFQLTGSFPSKQHEVKFLDQELEKMPDHAVDVEIQQLRAQLIPLDEETSGPDEDSSDDDSEDESTVEGDD